MRVVIIGGGVIGVTLAYYLSRRGANVVLFEMNELGSGSSFGNAGLLVPSYSTPLTSVANAIEGLRSIFGASSAVDVKIGPSIRTASWMVRFLISAARPHVLENGFAALAASAQRSLELFDELLSSAPEDVSYTKTGTLYVSRSAASLKQSVELANHFAQIGVHSTVMDSAQALAHEPTLSRSVAGAVWYPDDARLQPLNYVRFMADQAKAQGTAFRSERVTGFTLDSSGRATGVRVSGEEVAADRVVLAAGAWSPLLGRSLGLRVPIVPAKGYSFDMQLAQKPRTTMLFMEQHVSLTPMNDVIRGTTGLAFHGFNASISRKRIEQIHVAYGEYLDSPSILSEGPSWAGFRPLTSDGLPIIGASSRVGNVIFATGHGALGVTLAPATAESISRVIFDGEQGVDRSMLPARFGI